MLTPEEYARRVAEIRDRLQRDVQDLFQEGGDPFAEGRGTVPQHDAARAADAIAELGAILRDRVDPAPRRQKAYRYRVRKALGYTYP